MYKICQNVIGHRKPRNNLSSLQILLTMQDSFKTSKHILNYIQWTVSRDSYSIFSHFTLKILILALEPPNLTSALQHHSDPLVTGGKCREKMGEQYQQNKKCSISHNLKPKIIVVDNVHCVTDGEQSGLGRNRGILCSPVYTGAPNKK